jgi:hypothetical protein
LWALDAEYPEHYNVTIEVCGWDDVSITVYGTRVETVAEMEKRLKIQEKQSLSRQKVAKAKEEKERKEFLRLQKKFGQAPANHK